LSHRDTVLVIYGVCVLLALLSLGLSGRDQMYAFMGLAVLFGLVLLLIAKLGGGGNVVGEDLDRDSYDPAPDSPAAPDEPAAE
ncbi:MAG: hypothetical protein ACXWNR_09675, partial [Candidatus Limnocylindrales bacterium]